MLHKKSARFITAIRYCTEVMVTNRARVRANIHARREAHEQSMQMSSSVLYIMVSMCDVLVSLCTINVDGGMYIT